MRALQDRESNDRFCGSVVEESRSGRRFCATHGPGNLLGLPEDARSDRYTGVHSGYGGAIHCLVRRIDFPALLAWVSLIFKQVT